MRFPPGWHRFAVEQNSCPNLFMFRAYEVLKNRVLFYMQRKITKLEDIINQRDRQRAERNGAPPSPAALEAEARLEDYIPHDPLLERAKEQLVSYGMFPKQK